MEGEDATLRPRCIASNSYEEEHNRASSATSTAFKRAQWTPDGTSILAITEENKLETYILPQDLLTNPSHHNLIPYVSWQASSSILVSAVYPGFSLADPSTSLVLSSVRDQPIRLHNALDFSIGAVATYHCIKETTEEVLPQHSLVFTSDRTRFIAGGDALLSVFNVNRDGDGPIEQYPTAPGKKARKFAGENGVRGIISSLSINSDGTLAAGTYRRDVGLYEAEGCGKSIVAFNLRSPELGSEESAIAGTGITQLTWSPDARYLYIAERKSDCVQIYDARMWKRVGWLSGRKAKTNQRLDINVVATADGHEVWAGGTDGKVRIWRNPAGVEGEVKPWFEWKASEDPVVASLVHASGSVVATCSAPERVFWDMESDSDTDSDSSDSDQSASEGDIDQNAFDLGVEASKSVGRSLKIWSL